MKNLNITDYYVSGNNIIQITDGENDNKNINLKPLLLSIPGGVLILPLIGLMIWTLVKPLFS